MSLNSERFITATLSVAAVCVLLASYEALKMVVKQNRRHSRRKFGLPNAPVVAVVAKKPEEEDQVESDSDEEENFLVDPINALRIGADGRPVSGLQRDRLVVKENKMSDTEINMHLSILLDHLKDRTKFHLGYPYNLAFRSDNLVPFMQYSVNNLGDPFVASNYGVHSRDFELSVLEFFANIYNIKNGEYWGYCTCSGTEGNMLGVLYGREKLGRNCVLFCSKDTHYSVPKCAAMYCLDLELVDSDETGEMVYSDLEARMRKHEGRSMLINVNVGTTVKGASDTVDEVIAILNKLNVSRDKFYIHVDGALSGVILPFVSSRCENKRISFEKPIDSVSVSGHKMLGTPMPSGIVITRKEHSQRWAKDVEYLNSQDTTIMGSRNGQAAIAMWVALQRKGIDGLRSDVVQCIDNAKYLKEMLDKAGIPAWLNEFSTTVTFERPAEEVVQRWQLACKGDIAHAVVMPSVHKKKLRMFMEDFISARNAKGPHLPKDLRDTTQFTGGG